MKNNNRKITRGRPRHYQSFDDGTTFLHITETETQRITQEGMRKRMESMKPLREASKATKDKKIQKFRGTLVWNSSKDGTFYGNVKRDLF